MFASRSIVVHLLRGFAGFAALGFALVLQDAWSLLVVALALVALRGCPTRWTIGLIETMSATLRGRRSAGCSDASCANFSPADVSGNER